MINKLVRIIVALIVGALLWWCAGLILASIKAPAIVGTIVLVLFILAAVLFICYEFGLMGPPK